MTHMKMSDGDMKKEMTLGPEKRDSYPYGLRIRLGEAELKKLGMDDMPAVGDEIELDAKVKVVSTSENASEGSKNRMVELQITHVDMGSDDDEKSDKSPDARASTLYPSQGQ